MTVTREQVAEIVQLQLGCRQVELEDRLQEDLGADSADVLNLIVALEDRFDTTISEEDVADLVRVSDLLELVGRKVGVSRLG